MFKINTGKIPAIIWVLFLSACKNTTDHIPTPEVHIERMDKKLMESKSLNEIKDILSAEPLISMAFLGGTPDDPDFVENVYFMTDHPDARHLYEEVENTFGSLSNLEKDLGEAFGEIQFLYPDFMPPRIVAVFSGLNNDLLVSDSLVVISLESFIGEKASFRPNQPDYILRRYQPEYILPAVIRYLSNQFNQTDFSKDNFTTDMVFFGKSLEFCRQVLPQVPDSLLIGYTNREMQNAYENQEYIWSHVIDRELLNSENPAVNTKYFDERPFLAEISRDCPARIGQWLGWRIVELYKAKNPDISFQELMAMPNAEDILRGSKYRGQKD